MRLALIGVPFSLDQLQSAMGRAPELLVEHGLLERIGGLGAEAQFELLDNPLPEGTFDERMGVLVERIAQAVARAREAGALPVIIGGDCVTSVGTLAGLGNSSGTGVVWLDAHGDFNTPETTISNYLGGMPLACVVGRGNEALRDAAGLHTPLDEARIVLAGVRDLDAAEKALLDDSAVTVLHGAEVAMPEQVQRALAAVDSLPQVYLHLDIDVLDQAYAPGISYPAPGGLSPEQVLGFVGLVVRNGNVRAVALTAVNPERDVDNTTVDTALDLIEATLREVMSAA